MSFCWSMTSRLAPNCVCRGVVDLSKCATGNKLFPTRKLPYSKFGWKECAHFWCHLERTSDNDVRFRSISGIGLGRKEPLANFLTCRIDIYPDHSPIITAHLLTEESHVLNFFPRGRKKTALGSVGLERVSTYIRRLRPPFFLTARFLITTRRRAAHTVVHET